LLAVEIDFAVAAEPAGVHVDGFHHRAPTSNDGAFIADDGPSFDDNGHICGRAAHIRDSEILTSTEKSSAYDAGSRARQYGFDGIFERHFGAHQGSISLYDHQGRRNGFTRKHTAQRLDQMADMWREPRIESRCQRSLRRI